MNINKISLSFVAVAALIGAPFLTAPTASAATSGAATCGSGYSAFATTNSGRYNGNSNTSIGRLTLYRNASAKKICAIHQKAKDYGVATDTTVFININNGKTIRQDSAYYKFYAGPVYLTYGNWTDKEIRTLSIGAHQKVGNRLYSFYDEYFTNTSWKTTLVNSN